MTDDFMVEFVIDGDKGPVVVYAGVDGNSIFVGSGHIRTGNYLFAENIAGVEFMAQLTVLAKRWYKEWV